jgi:hypothetical protein
VAKELVGEKLYVYGVVCTAAAEKNSIIKIDRRWHCRGFGQGPKLVSVSHRNICTNIQCIKREIPYIIFVYYISKGNTRFENDLASFVKFLL